MIFVPLGSRHIPPEWGEKCSKWPNWQPDEYRLHECSCQMQFAGRLAKIGWLCVLSFPLGQEQRATGECILVSAKFSELLLGFWSARI